VCPARERRGTGHCRPARDGAGWKNNTTDQLEVFSMVRVVVQEGTRAVVYRDGAVVAAHGPGRHRLPRAGFALLRRRIEVVDVRLRLLVVPAQEVAASDVPGVKVSVAVRWAVADPVAFLGTAVDPAEDLRLVVQVAVRDWVAERSAADVVDQRAQAGRDLTPVVAAAVLPLGVSVAEVVLRDVVLPGEVRRALLATASARQEGIAALERARGETAALRSLANGARALADSPALLQLRTVQTAVEGGASVVLHVGATPASSPTANGE